MTAKKKRASTTPAPAAKKKPPAKPTVPPSKEPTPVPAGVGGPTAKKYSALDAAALVLRESGQPLSCPELIAQMAAKGYWSSPQGKTPSATLCAALLREIKLKDEAARFAKTGPGTFAFRTPRTPRS